MYTYKDFVTGKIKRTRGRFVGWTQPTGLLNERYAIFRNRASDVLVPRYLLTEETASALVSPEDLERFKQGDRVRLRRPGFPHEEDIRGTVQRVTVERVYVRWDGFIYPTQETIEGQTIQYDSSIAHEGASKMLEIVEGEEGD